MQASTDGVTNWQLYNLTKLYNLRREPRTTQNLSLVTLDLSKQGAIYAVNHDHTRTQSGKRMRAIFVDSVDYIEQSADRFPRSHTESIGSCCWGLERRHEGFIDPVILYLEASSETL